MEADLLARVDRQLKPGLEQTGDGSPAIDASFTHSRKHRTVAQAQWPVLKDAAYHGLPGDITKTITPHTESDPVAILINTLIMFGWLAGRTSYSRVGGTFHYPNEFAVLVGETSRARKGTAHHEVKRVVEDPNTLLMPRETGGLSSGEGLINAVRDPTWITNKKGEREKVDEGVSDKRLLVVEPEFSSPLKVASREGNTLSDVLRRAWDGDDLSTLTRNSALRATEPHICMLAHITQVELSRLLSQTNQVNGFANRFLFMCVRRSKLLPDGGMVPHDEMAALHARFKHSVDAAHQPRELKRDKAASERWREAYVELTKERTGLFGAIIARAEAHVLRLSLIYALLDESKDIQLPHLEAALAVWEYAEASARFIFGDATGDEVADRILAALRNNGSPMTQTQISGLFDRNESAGRLNHALGSLLSDGKVRTWAGESSGGRTPTYWEAA